MGAYFLALIAYIIYFSAAAEEVNIEHKLLTALDPQLVIYICVVLFSGVHAYKGFCRHFLNAAVVDIKLQHGAFHRRQGFDPLGKAL